jgi:hypothetical protein
MPDSSGKLSPEESNKVLEIVNNKWKKGIPCELCGSVSQWLIGSYVVSPVMLENGKGFLLGGQTLPSVPVFCKTCGNTKLINALIMNIIPRSSETKNG